MTTEDSLKATPRPWITEDADHPADIRIYSEGHGKLIAVIGNAEKPWTDHVEEWQANAELIVTSVNGIDALREENLRLREALKKIDEMTSEGFREGDFIDLLDFIGTTARAALGEVK